MQQARQDLGLIMVGIGTHCHWAGGGQRAKSQGKSARSGTPRDVGPDGIASAGRSSVRPDRPACPERCRSCAWRAHRQRNPSGGADRPARSGIRGTAVPDDRSACSVSVSPTQPYCAMSYRPARRSPPRRRCSAGLRIGWEGGEQRVPAHAVTARGDLLRRRALRVVEADDDEAALVRLARYGKVQAVVFLQHDRQHEGRRSSVECRAAIAATAAHCRPPVSLTAEAARARRIAEHVADTSGQVLFEHTGDRRRDAAAIEAAHRDGGLAVRAGPVVVQQIVAQSADGAFVLVAKVSVYAGRRYPSWRRSCCSARTKGNGSSAGRAVRASGRAVDRRAIAAAHHCCHRSSRLDAAEHRVVNELSGRPRYGSATILVGRHIGRSPPWRSDSRWKSGPPGIGRATRRLAYRNECRNLDPPGVDISAPGMARLGGRAARTAVAAVRTGASRRRVRR